MKRALIISPAYPAPYTHPPTPNDRADWLATLAGRGFTALSTDPGLTRTLVLAALWNFAGSLQAGDSGALILLGHGGRLRGNEPDGYDECYVPADLQAIRDHEIGQILKTALLRGVKIDVVSEFCYSGTSTDGQLRTWCACGAGQLAWWGYSAGLERSIFSLYLCYALRQYPTKTAAQIMPLVKGWVTAMIPGQTPQLDGPGTSVIPF